MEPLRQRGVMGRAGTKLLLMCNGIAALTRGVNCQRGVRRVAGFIVVPPSSSIYSPGSGSIHREGILDIGDDGRQLDLMIPVHRGEGRQASAAALVPVDDHCGQPLLPHGVAVATP